MILSPLDTRFLTNKTYQDFRAFAVACGRLSASERDELSEGFSSAESLQELIGSMDKKSDEIAALIEESCDFWYRESYDIAPEPEMRARYQGLYQKIFSEMEKLQADLPVFVQQILKSEKETIERSLLEQRFSGWPDECYTKTEIHIFFLEGSFYWLTRVGRDLEEIRKGLA